MGKIMEARSKKEEEEIVEEMEELISNWQTYGKQTKKEKPLKLVKGS
jgi:hypothetical protein